MSAGGLYEMSLPDMRYELIEKFLKVSKLPGSDEIDPIVLKELAAELSVHLFKKISHVLTLVVKKVHFRSHLLMSFLLLLCVHLAKFFMAFK